MNYKNKKCPHCKKGKLRPVEGDNEILYWCDECDCAVDSDGGYIV